MKRSTKSIYSYSVYKAYLLDRLKSAPQGEHGMRSRLAKAVGCQLAYVSHVLNGDRDFSVDQAEAATRFFVLGPDEAEFFIWMVEHARAGTEGTRKFFALLMNRKRQQFTQFRDRVAIQDELSDLDKAVYYGSYLYAATHMLVTLPEFRSVETISQRLGQSTELISEVLRFLKTRGLVNEFQGKFDPGSRYLFIDRKSPFIFQHHTHWRLQALQGLIRKSEENLHLSMVVTLSSADAEGLRQRMAEFIEGVSRTIKDSKEERLMAINLDFFDV